MFPENIGLHPSTGCSTSHLELDRSSLAINKVLLHLEPYLRELKPDIAGVHIFQEDSNVDFEKTSVIFVGNTNLAKEKGIHFNIPGKLMRVCSKEVNDDDGKERERQLIIKPLTVVVGEYVIHISICCEHESCSLSKETQTSYLVKRISDSNLHNIESASTSLKIRQATSNPSVLQNVGEHNSTVSLPPNTPKLLESLSQISEKRNLEFEQIYSVSQRNSEELDIVTNNSKLSCILNTEIPQSDLNEENITPENSSYNSDDDVDREQNKIILGSKISSNVSRSSSRSFKICSKDGQSETSACSTNKRLPNSRNSSRNQPCPGKTRVYSFAGKKSRTSNGSEVSLKQIKERLNTVTFSLQQLKSVIEIMDSSEEGSMLYGHDDHGDTETHSESSEAESKSSEMFYTLCDRCGSFYSKTKLTNHFCAKPSSLESSFDDEYNITSTQKFNSEKMSLKQNKIFDVSDGGVEIISKNESFETQSSVSNELFNGQTIIDARAEDKIESRNEDDMESVLKPQTTNRLQNLRNNYFKFIANRFTKSDSFKVRNQVEKISSQKVKSNKNVNVPTKKSRMFKSLGNILYFANQIKTNIGKSKPIALKNSTQIIELYSNSTSDRSSSKSLHVMPSSSSSVREDEIFIPDSTLQPIKNTSSVLDLPKIEDRSHNTLESTSSLSYGLQSWFCEGQTSYVKEERNSRFKRKNKRKEKRKRKFNLFCFKI